MLGQDIHADWIFLQIVEQLDLGDDLIGERTAHHKTWMTRCTTKVDESTLGQHNNCVTIGKCPEVGALF